MHSMQSKKHACTQTKQKAFLEAIQAHQPDLVVLAGFMKIIDSHFIESLNGKIINLHPSLLPSFPGINSIETAFNFPVKITGCTVHWVIPEIDAGMIIDQKAVTIEPNDTIESLSEKVHSAEHQLLPEVIRQLSTGEVSFSKLTIIMTDAPLDLKISVQIPDDYVDALESYFYECDPNPWVLIQKTAADPYYLSGYFNQEQECTQAIDALKKIFLISTLPLIKKN